ncbi:unnamed protein product [Effrenium voratum]|nr:unnamed protein product [Effrenium voratum]
MGRQSRLVNAIRLKKLEDDYDDGPFIDYMLREVARRGMLTSEVAQAEFAKEPLSFVRRVLVSDTARAAADQALVREQLLWKMSRQLLMCPTPARCGGFQAMKKVRAVLRAAKLLQSKVSLHLLHQHVEEAINRRELRRQEGSCSRHHRLKNFWPQFHNSSRFGTLVARNLIGDLVLPEVKGVHTASKKGQAGNPKKTLDWKSRGARSHCSAGSWNWLPKLEVSEASALKQQSSSTSRLTPLPEARSPYAKESNACGLGGFVRDKTDIFPKLVAEGRPHSLLPNSQDVPETALLLKGKFQRPWDSGHVVQSLSTKQYLSACNREGLLPSTDPFVTGHSDCINAKAQGLSDRDLFAICEMLEMGSPLRELDLEGNAGISERAFLHLFKHLQAKPAEARKVCELEKLSLAGCVGLVQDEPFAGLIQLISCPRLDGLQILSLSGLPIGVKWQVPLCKALRSHVSIRQLSLADTGLGTHSSCEDDTTMVCVVELLSSKSIAQLDLSWNCIGQAGFDFLGQKLNELGILEKLDLSHCSTLSKKSWTSSAVHLLEHLRDNQSLQSLSIAGNYLDFRAALLLEDSLEYNLTLRQLDVSNNSLGSPGMRSLLRLLARSTSGLQSFNFENCSKGAIRDSRSDMQVFRASRPHGRYELDLSRPYDRTLLRMLYKTSDRLGLGFDQTFRDISAEGFFSHPPKSSQGLYQIPQAGKVWMTFTMDKVLEDRMAAQGGADFFSLIRCHSELLRIKPCRSTLVALLAQWKRMEGLGEDQSIMIDALSKDFSLKYPEIAVLCQSRAQSWDVVASLQCAIPAGHQLEKQLCLRLIPSSCDFVRMLQRSESLLSFNPNNPTGHYSLDLSNPIDYTISERLAILDNWESVLRSSENKADISQLGNYSHARNTQYSNCPLPRSFTEWIPVEYDILELDYCSSKRGLGKEAMTEAAFDGIVTALLQFARHWKCRLQALQQLSDQIYFSCAQLRQIVDLFKESGARQDVYVTFFNRIVDMQNEKLVRARLDMNEVSTILYRLGHAGCFPYMQPEQMHIRLHFKNHEERLLMSYLLKLSIKESLANIKDPQFTSSDGTVDALTLGVPRSWEQMSNIPKQGVFEAEYVCKPEDRNLKMRKDLAEQLGAWTCTGLEEEEITFVSFLGQVPPDVVSLVAWASHSFGPGLSGTFDQIGKEVNSKEFEEALKGLGFNKFKGPREQQRFQQVFRHMDSKFEGKISQKDWRNLEELGQEIQQSIRETRQFCERLFASSAWAVLSDGKGRISQDQVPQQPGRFGLQPWTYLCNILAQAFA